MNERHLHPRYVYHQWPPASNRLYLTNIGNATECSIKGFMDVIDSVVDVKVVRDDKGRSYAFVEFADKQTATMAIRNLNGSLLWGRPVRIEYANGSDRQSRKRKW